VNYCISCGTALAPNARFCGTCGAPIDSGAMQSAIPSVSASETVESIVQVEPDAPIAVEDHSDAPGPKRTGPNWLLIGGGAGIALLLIGYYAIFLRDDIAAPAAPVAAQKPTPVAVESVKLYAAAQANIRDRSTTVGTEIIGKAVRGFAVSGVIVTGEDGATPWLQLDDDKGFIAMSNLTENVPPEIIKALGDRVWRADRPLDLYTGPDKASPMLDRVAAGTPLTLFGLTGNGFVEIKLKKGGVAYLADGVRIAEASSAKGPPMAISFNPSSCNFGGELEVEFQKLTAKSRAAFEAIDKTDFPSDAARDRALAGFEGKSYFQRLERSYNGLSITGIAQHYESQSIYFADAPDKVIAVFRAAGHKIGRDGQFPATELYAGIGATAGEGRSYGKSDLSCGV
jgi:hypothetical protein